jgi:hypothetical protein
MVIYHYVKIPFLGTAERVEEAAEPCTRFEGRSGEARPSTSMFSSRTGPARLRGYGGRALQISRMGDPRVVTEGDGSTAIACGC